MLHSDVLLLEGESSWSATAAGHTTAHAAEGVSAATAAALEMESSTSASSASHTTSHATSKHLHEDLGVDATAHATHAATHAAAAAKHIRRIDEIGARVVSLTFSASR
jgi:hypothetical protein